MLRDQYVVLAFLHRHPEKYFWLHLQKYIYNKTVSFNSRKLFGNVTIGEEGT